MSESADEFVARLTTRILRNDEDLQRLGEFFRSTGMTIVVTIGSFDLTHTGHARYLAQAKKLGDVLVVGVDSDAAVKRYKGEDRPMVPEEERMEMLLHLGYVDFVTKLDDVDADGVWQFGLIQLVRPHIFVAVRDSYDDQQLDQIKQFADDVVVFPRQAPTSTSERIRQAALTMNQGIPESLRALADVIEKGEPLIAHNRPQQGVTDA